MFSVLGTGSEEVVGFMVCFISIPHLSGNPHDNSSITLFNNFSDCNWVGSLVRLSLPSSPWVGASQLVTLKTLDKVTGLEMVTSTQHKSVRWEKTF